MRVFDASSMIYAWDNYPVAQFPGLWEWMASQIQANQLVMPKVAFEEVGHIAPDCGEWLEENNLEKLELSELILRDAIRIKGLLGISGDNYHAKGVDENDILIIATARAQNSDLISDEAKQPGLPQLPSKRKIPAVCDMAEVTVHCVNFIDFIKTSGAVFG